jgi:hypothetical protein
MQTPSSIPHTPLDWLWLLLASGLGASSATWYNVWKNRKKPVQEIHESEARTELARAQATQTVAQTLHSISVQLKEAKDSISGLEERFDRTRYELDNVKLVANRVPDLEKRIEAQHIANTNLSLMNERMAARLRLAGIEFPGPDC